MSNFESIIKLHSIQASANEPFKSELKIWQPTNYPCRLHKITLEI